MCNRHTYTHTNTHVRLSALARDRRTRNVRRISYGIISTKTVHIFPFLPLHFLRFLSAHALSSLKSHTAPLVVYLQVSIRIRWTEYSYFKSIRLSLYTYCWRNTSRVLLITWGPEIKDYRYVRTKKNSTKGLAKSVPNYCWL